MDFFNEYLIYIILAAIVFVTVVIVPILKKNDVLPDEASEYVDTAFMVAELVVRATNLNDATKDKITLIMDIVEDVINYMDEVQDVVKPEDRKRLAKEFTNEVYKELKIELTEEEAKLVNELIEESLDLF